ncbi:MAG: hypothetical protein QOI38_57 [Sphingomonadales bacterium]|nr:hypothetical protein [Sphingomonadales bacterium]
MTGPTLVRAALAGQPPLTARDENARAVGIGGLAGLRAGGSAAHPFGADVGAGRHAGADVGAGRHAKAAAA